MPPTFLCFPASIVFAGIQGFNISNTTLNLLRTYEYAGRGL